jgi:hypothetical protein
VQGREKPKDPARLGRHFAAREALGLDDPGDPDRKTAASTEAAIFQ